MDNKRTNAGASIQEVGFKKRFEAWIAHHQQVAVETLIRLLQNPFSSVFTWFVIAIALTLPGALWRALENTSQSSNQCQASRRITLYLKPAISMARGQSLSQRLLQV